MKESTLLQQLSLEERKSEDKTLAKIVSFVEENPSRIYLVGGYLRDWLLGQVSLDIDFLVLGDAESYAAKLAQALGGSFFVLDEKREIVRVAVKEKEVRRTVDFSPLKTSLEQDLKSRDFSIDTLALDFTSLIKKGLVSSNNLIDLTGGLDDLAKKKIRAVSLSVFLADPLRLLRAVRLGAELDFRIEEKTEKLIKKDSSMLEKATRERIKDELLGIVSSPSSASAIGLAGEVGLLKVILPEVARLKGVTQNNYHHLDVYNHTLLALEELERVVADLDKFFSSAVASEITIYLEETISENCSRLALIKLATLFHDLGKLQVRLVNKAGHVCFYNHPTVSAQLALGISRRLRLGKKLAQSIAVLVKEHMRVGFLAKQKPPSERARRRFFREVGDMSLGVIVLSLADRLAVRGPLSTEGQLKHYISFSSQLAEVYCQEKERVVLPPLISGYDLMSRFSLQSGPPIGEILKRVREAQEKEEIASKEEAFRLIAEILEKKQET